MVTSMTEESCESCESCGHGVFVKASMMRDCPGMVSKRAHVICHRYPKTIETAPEHWCGEHVSARLSATQGRE